MIATLAGFALIGAIGNGLSSAMAADKSRESALFTFLVTASGAWPRDADGSRPAGRRSIPKWGWWPGGVNSILPADHRQVAADNNQKV
jgi:hypothetical protein